MMTNSDIVQSSYTAFQRGDVDAALADFAPDIQWTQPDGMNDYGLGGTKKGHAEVRAFMARACTVFSELRPVPEEIVEADDRVVVFGAYHLRGARSGVAGTVPFVHSWRIVDGKATHFSDLHDTAGVRAIVEGRVRTATDGSAGAHQPPESTRDWLMKVNENLTHGWALQLAAELGIADQLSAGPRSSANLAVTTATHPQAMYRLLRTLSGAGVFTEVEPGIFGLAPCGTHLRTDDPQSIRAIMMISNLFSRAFIDAMHSMRTGEPAFLQTFGEPLFAYLRRHHDLGALFNAAMAAITRLETAAILDAYDFATARRIVDVGGGDGTLLTAILRAQPAAAGVIFDQPEVIDDARARIRASGLAKRCSVVGGDFFEDVPSGADLYLLKWVLHDWSDAQAVEILHNCRRAMPPGSKLLLIERVIPPGDTPHSSKVIDFTMLVIVGGKERTGEEYAALLAKAGLRLTRVVTTSAESSIIEAVPERDDMLPLRMTA
jgi:ketosteroid isomerase-like protein